MDQIYQLQRQIQDLRQEVNTIGQFASQLHRAEANNAAQLQRIQQNEVMASQQLQAIQQLCNRLSQDVNTISSVAQQMGTQIMNNRPITTGQFGANLYTTTPISGQFGTTAALPGTGFAGTQFGTFGAQFGGARTDEFARNQQISSMAANRYGLGQLYSTDEYTANQYVSNMANQGMLGAPQGTMGMVMPAQNWGTYGTAGIGASGYASVPAGNFQIQPAHPTQQQLSYSQYGSSAFAPWSNQLSTGMFGVSQNIGRYSNF